MRYKADCRCCPVWEELGNYIKMRGVRAFGDSCALAIIAGCERCTPSMIESYKFFTTFLNWARARGDSEAELERLVAELFEPASSIAH